MKIAAAARKPILIHCRTSELATPQAKQKFGPRRRLGRPPRPHRRTLDPAQRSAASCTASPAASRTGRALPRRRLPPLLRRQPHLPQIPIHPRSRRPRPRRPHPGRNRRPIPRPHPPPRPAQRTRPRHPHRRSPRRAPRHLTGRARHPHHRTTSTASSPPSRS